MRDAVLTLVFLVLLGMAFKRPAIGAFLWAWISLMNPHQMCFGFALGIPFALLSAVVTLLLLPGAKPRQALPINLVTLLWLAMVFWMGFTSFFAMAPSEDVLDRLVFVAKIQMMLLATMLLVTNERDLRTLIAVVTASVAFFSVKGGIGTILTGGSARIYGPPGGMLAGNNEAGVGFVIVTPLLYWFLEASRSIWMRRFLWLAIILSILAALGTQSRGALLAVTAMALFLGFKSRHPVRVTVLIALALVVGIAFMPDDWSKRMETIGGYQGESSAMSRLWIWTTYWNAAVDHPIVGVGFQADTPAMYALYAPKGGQFQAFGFNTVWVAHSIYFQMLGEHGFVGLGLFLALWLAVWWRASRIGREAAKVPDLAKWMPSLMSMVKASLLGYLVGGAFLSLAYLDLPYYVMSFVVLSEAILRRNRASGVQPVGQLTAAGVGAR